ncbi:Mediator of DNA damage checkpoint protein 1 [Camellia lanceoleosa]|uniref:Mediator of DNA damage checkpoint protein 1 n=1 Tax=Camellia lanceoleosa TaxID=1840588 RepID=A0ACC0HJ30_9ERIC|nr:Mediator of DNA damage checkpoint protein 1 [Camellia lanceoleosa]
MDFNQEVGFGSSTGRKSKPDSSAKGTQSLVKITNLKITAGERDFDWDDSREDEGGEFFTKKKEAFFDNGGQRKRSVSKPRKHLDSKRNGVVDETRDKEDQQDIHQKVKGLVNSNSGLVLRNSKRNDKTTKVTKTKSKKNLTKELDEPLNIGSSDGLEATGTDKDMTEVLNVGFDTQMAAEAMEVLCAGLDMADHDNKDIDQGTKNMFEASPRAKKNRAQSKENFLQERSISSSFGVITRNSKKTKSIGNKLRKESTVSSQKQAKNVRKQCDTELVKEEMKKAKSNAEGHFATNWIEKIDREQIEEERALKRNDIDVVDRCHVIASSSGYRSVKKRSLQEQLGTFTPIARRTRQRRVTNQIRDGITSCDSSERLHLTETRQGYSTGSDAFKMVGKEKFSKLGSNQSRELENVKLTEQKKSHQKVTDTTTVVGIGPLRYNKGKELVESSLSIRKKAWSSACAGPVLRTTDRQSKGTLFQRSVDKGGLGDASLTCNSVDGNVIPKRCGWGFASKQSDRNSDADTTLAGEGAEENARFEVSPGDRCKQSGSTFTTTVNCTTPINAASPICLGRFGASVASSISEATQFITDKFVRLRNMLEAIAFGKPVVTHLWLESCGETGCFMDERNYILRDAKRKRNLALACGFISACK